MNQLQRIGVKQFERDARHAEHIGLARERLQGVAALVIHIRVAEQRDGETSLADSGAHVDVFAKHFTESAHGFPYFAAVTHIERARHKLFELHLAASDTACGEERRHRKRDGFLRVVEVGAGGIGSAEAVHRLFFQRCLQRFEVLWRNHAIAVEKYEVIAFGTLNSVVSGNAASVVFLPEIVHVHLVGIGLRNVVASLCGAVLHEHHLKVAVGLF